MNRTRSWHAALAVAALATAGCAPAPSLHYRVDFAARTPEGVPVSLRVDGAPRDSFVLQSLAPAELAPLSAVSASAGDTPLEVTRSTRTREDDGGRRDFTFLRVAGPLPRSFTVSYRVRLDARGGNEHTGFTGERAGEAGETYAYAAGRTLFLVPGDTRRIGPIDVAFALPEGWSAAVPWRRDGDVWRPGVRGGAAVQDLVRSGLGFGRFEEREVALRGTRFRFAVEVGVPPAVRDTALARLEAVARSVTDAFGRGLGDSYLTVVMPEHPDGDEYPRYGWATGAGGTLAPLTTARALGFAEGLVDAYLAEGPYRTVVRDPNEHWLVMGLSRLLPWRALERAGLSAPEDFTRSLAVNGARALGEADSSDIERNLERLATTERDPQLAREVLAPLALLRIGVDTHTVSSGRVSFEDVLHRVFAGGVARSLWRELPSPGDDRWARLRARYVRGESGLIDDPLFAQLPPWEWPDPPRGETAGRLIVACTGNTYGYLENCGCKVNQAGGVARRATLLDRLRRQGPLVVLDAGNALGRPDHFEAPDTLALEEEKLYLRTMRTMRYALGAVGTAELAYGLGRFRAAARATGFPYVLANAADSAGPIAPEWRLVHAPGVRLGVVGLLEPGRGPWANDVFERRLGPALAFADPVATLRRLLPEVRRRSDLVVAMGALSPPTVRRLVRECPDLDLVISTDDEAGTLIREDGERRISGSDEPGFIGRTLVLYTSMSSYGVTGATLRLDAARRITAADPFASWLGDSIPEDRRMRQQLTRFYDAVGRTQAAQASVRPLFPDDTVRLQGRYVGAARCAPCHAPEFEQWKDTPHAEAWKTLLDVHRHYQPRCVVCHVVGYGTPHGFRLGRSDERLVNVQCEICHGPGAEHVASPTKATIRRAVPEAVCLQCHTPDHSDHFVYTEKLPRVEHQGPREIHP